MSTNTRTNKRTSGRATGPRQGRAIASRAGRGIELNTTEGWLVVIVWGLLASLAIGVLAGPARAWTQATWDRALRWGMHDVRDPALEDIPVQAEGSGRGYARAAFGKGWARRDGCSVEQLVVRRDVTGGQVRGCAVTGGTVTDPYDGGTTAYTPGAFDVDHVVSLAEAWRSGAAAWTAADRQAFANDPDVLLLVPASENRSKGDKDPGQWQPTTAAGRCLYARKVVAIKYRYLLTVDPRERNALDADLAQC